MICDRRTLFTTATRLALGTRLASAGAQGANDRIRIGIIGRDGRARGLMNHVTELPGDEIVAIGDVDEPRLGQAAEIAGTGAARSRQTPNAPVRVGHEAARTSHIASAALTAGHQVRWNAASGAIDP